VLLVSLCIFERRPVDRFSLILVCRRRNELHSLAIPAYVSGQIEVKGFLSAVLRHPASSMTPILLQPFFCASVAQEEASGLCTS
jgi:hypothetical protein